MLGQQPTCEAIVQGGSRCRATPMRDLALCFFHNRSPPRTWPRPLAWVGCGCGCCGGGGGA